MSGKVFGTLMLLTALILAAKIGADFASYEAKRDVRIAVVADDQELIDLEPNLPYAYISADDGKLYIDISTNNPNYQDGFGEGVSPDSTYAFDCMFKVSNNLWEEVPISVTVSSDNSKVLVYSGEEEAGSETTFIVESGDSVCVGIVISAENYSPGDTIPSVLTIHAEKSTE